MSIGYSQHSSQTREIMEHTSMCAWLQSSHSIISIMESQQHFNHLSDVKHEVDNYHSVPHDTLVSLLAQGLKELNFPGNRNQDHQMAFNAV